MRISKKTAAHRGLGGLWLHPDPTPDLISQLCKEIQSRWAPEEFLERRSYQEPVSERRRMSLRKRREMAR